MKKSVLFGGLEDEEDCPLTAPTRGNGTLIKIQRRASARRYFL